jgi:hypothetical protein
MASTIESIQLEKLLPHPDNPNRMSKANFAKLIRNIHKGPATFKSLMAIIDTRHF